MTLVQRLTHSRASCIWPNSLAAGNKISSFQAADDTGLTTLYVHLSSSLWTLLCHRY